MEELHRTVDTRELMETYRELLKEADCLPLGVTGSSMTPFLAPGRDRVWLTAVKRPLKVGDVVLYQRDSGAYILHRICRVEGDRFALVGDAHRVIEHGVRRDQIFALVNRVERKGKILTAGSFWWEFFEKLWVRMIPLRGIALRLYGVLSR